MAAARAKSKAKSKTKKPAPAKPARKKPAKAKPRAKAKPKPKPRAKPAAAPRPVKPDVTVRLKKPAGAPRPPREPVSAAGVTVDIFQNAQPLPQRAIIAALRELVKTTVPDATESFKWGQPVFELNGPLLFLRSAKAHVTFGFWRGAELEDQGFIGLEGDGDHMRHLKISSLDEIDHATLGGLVDAAAELNRQLGDPRLPRLES